VGASGDLAAGWSLARTPRPTGAASGEERLDRPPGMLCPDCARALLRDLEARLEP
jgi:hypothetical protein